MDLETEVHEDVPAVLVTQGGRIVDRLSHPGEPGLWATPGLIDTHLHWLMFAGTSMPELVEELTERPARAWERCVAQARAALRAGITTACDKGSPTAGVGHLQARLGARRAAERDVPRTVYAPFMAVDRESFAGAWCRQVTREDEAPALARAAAEGGGAVLKIIPEGDWRDARPRYPQTISDALVHAAARAARDRGMLVAVHGKSRASIELALEAGVDGIEHGLEAEAAHLRAMQRRGVSLALTLHGFARRLAWAEAHGRRLEVAREEWSQAARVARLIADDEGFDRLVTGSDAGSFDTPHGTLDELYHLRRCGISARRVLRAATVGGARALRREGELGTLRAGARADVVLWDVDPLALPEEGWRDLARHVVAVVCDGELAWSRGPL